MGFWQAVASAGPYAGNLHLTPELQTDNYTNTSSLNFLQARCCSWCPTNSVKALKARTGSLYFHVFFFFATLQVRLWVWVQLSGSCRSRHRCMLTALFVYFLHMFVNSTHANNLFISTEHIYLMLWSVNSFGTQKHKRHLNRQ